MDLKLREIGGLLKRGGVSYKIPTNQRPYAWGEQQINKFIEDLVSDDIHIFGFMSLDEEIRSKLHIIIDGQQRLLTLTLVYKAISVLMSEHPQTNEKHDSDINYLKEGILADDGKTPRITHQESGDKTIYTNIILGFDEESTNNITSGYDFIYSHFQSKGIDELRDVVNKLRAEGLKAVATFIKQIGDKIDTQKMFDDINTTGKSLTSSDVIKNLIYEVDDVKIPEWVSTFEMNKKWCEYSRQNSGDNHHDRFLSLFLSIETGESCKPKNNVFGYQNWFKRKGVDPNFTNRLIEYANIYGSVVNISTDYSKLMLSDKERNAFSTFDNIGKSNNLVILLTLVFIKYKTHSIERENILSLLENIVIYNHFSSVGGRDDLDTTINRYLLDNLFRSDLTNLSFDTIQRWVNNQNTFKNVISNFSRNLIERKMAPKKVKYLLYRLNISLQSKFSDISLKKLEEYTLEHVLPRKYDKWFDTAKLTESEIVEIEIIKETIGNLILIPQSLNSKVKNQIYSEKKQSYRDNISLELSKRMLINNTWDIDTIKTNTETIYNDIINLFENPLTMKPND